MFCFLLIYFFNKLDIFDYCAVQEKNPYPPHGRSLEIPRGRGVLGVKKLGAKYEANLEFPGGGGGGGCKTKNLPWGEYGYFLEIHVLLETQF